MVERDEKGRVRKGSALNPTGIDRRKAMMLRDLEALTPRAIARLGTLIDSDQPAIALGAAKEVLNRNLGVPKARLDVTVEHSVSAMHMAALKELADKARHAQENIIDVTPLSPVDLEPTLIEIVEQHQVLSNLNEDNG
ncbi:hypothetical protein UFOVP155_53 [uncultured Caudovirales phage]|uniref:Terminase small subunit n=1 Tax=uncultured Caudovirales phage TaxID=2100421 RepID=A0A6J7WE70_9CAUD|nr:hypothetical protein UFOVP155_53 [uncultured Caudovirales phage]